MLKARESYRTIKILIEAGSIKKLSELFDHISLEVVAEDLGISHNRLRYKLGNIGKFTINELCNMADLFEVEEMKIVDLAHAQHLSNKGF